MVSSFTNKRGQKLATFAWGSDHPSAVIVFIHGFGEYSSRYDSTFLQLAHASKELRIASYDLHGHGQSEPSDEKSRAYVDHFDDLVDDAEQFFDSVRASYPSVPIFLLGHSLGGLITIHLVLKLKSRNIKVSGLILSAALVDVEWTPVLKIQASIGDCLAKCIPFSKIVPAVRPEDMNTDPDEIKAYKEDKLIYQGNVKANSGNEILKGMKYASTRLSGIDSPILAMHGTKDKTTSLSAVKRLIDTSQSKDKKLELVEGAYHEIFFHKAHAQKLIGLVATFVKERSGVSGATSSEAVKVKV